MDADFLDKLWVGLVSGSVGVALSEVVHRLRVRTALVATVAERYISEVRTGTDTPAFRLGAMQQSGVALLTPRQIKRFVSEVVGRGCANPFKDSDIEQFVPIKKFPRLLRAASERGIPLSDGVALYDFLFQLIAQAKKEEAKKAGKGSNE